MCQEAVWSDVGLPSTFLAHTARLQLKGINKYSIMFECVKNTALYIKGLRLQHRRRVSGCCLERGPTKAVSGTRRLSAVTRKIASVGLSFLNTGHHFTIETRLYTIIKSLRLKHPIAWYYEPKSHLKL